MGCILPAHGSFVSWNVIIDLLQLLAGYDPVISPPAPEISRIGTLTFVAS